MDKEKAVKNMSLSDCQAERTKIERERQAGVWATIKGTHKMIGAIIRYLGLLRKRIARLEAKVEGKKIEKHTLH